MVLVENISIMCANFLKKMEQGGQTISCFKEETNDLTKVVSFMTGFTKGL
jgi:hypothetical protein